MFQLFLVLRVAIADHANGRNAQPQQIAVALRGVALEITMQYTFSLSNSQFVVRAGKVIHTNKLITGAGQRSDGLLQNIELLLRRRQISVFDFALCGE